MEKKHEGDKEGSSALAGVAASIEERIAAASVEHAVVLDEAGTLLVDKEGERTEVSFTPDEVARMRGAAVFTHNHPGGTSFSLPDILIAKRLNIREMRVVTEQALYILRPPPVGWPALALRELLNAIQEADAKVEEELRRQIRVDRLSKAEANKRHWHEVWTQVSRRVGLHYTQRT
jgi:hypothetical protein